MSIFLLIFVLILIFWLWIEVYFAWKKAIKIILQDYREIKKLNQELKNIINK